MTVSEFVSLYGPLGFGWIAAIFLFRENRQINDKFHTMVLSDIKVKAGLAQRLKELAAIIREGFGGD